jgi:hypothetical protein
MVTSFRCLLSLALLLGIATPAWADSPSEPASCKLRGAKRIVVGRFQLTAGELNTFKQSHRFAEHPPRGTPSARIKRANLADLIAVISATPSRTQKSIVPNQESHIEPWCGIVDDWHYAALAAYQQCNSSPGASNGNAYFKADNSYSGFNDTLNHHALFQPVANLSLAESDVVLEGNCYVCSSIRSVGNATAIPRNQIQPPKPVE